MGATRAVEWEEVEATREDGGRGCGCEKVSSAVLSASLLLPLLNAFSPELFCFLALICTVVEAVVVCAVVEWTCDCRVAEAESPGFRTHIANMAKGGTGGRDEK